MSGNHLFSGKSLGLDDLNVPPAPHLACVIQSMVHTNPQISFQAEITSNSNQLETRLETIELKLDFNHG